MKTFAITLVADIYSQNVPGHRFGLVEFSTTPNTVIGLQSYATAAGFQTIINGLNNQGGTTGIKDAIEVALAETMDPTRNRVIIFMADGGPYAGTLNCGNLCDLNNEPQCYMPPAGKSRPFALFP